MQPLGIAPRVSIVIPTRNRHRSIQQCVSACLALEYPVDRYEILVIDDGSEPRLPRSDDPRVRVIRQPGAGPAAARNRGIHAASGVWIAFTDDDCRPSPGWLARLADVLSDAPNSLIGGHTMNALTGNPYAAASQFLVDYLYEYLDRRPRQRFFTSNNMAGSRERLLDIGGFDEGFPFAGAEDRDLCDRWTNSGGSLLYVRAAVIDHYHDMSLTGFLRQQFRYGSGAVVLSARRAARGFKLRPEPPTFYFGLLAAPFRSCSAGAALRLSTLLLLAQVANSAGFVVESWRRKVVTAAST